MPVPVIDPTTDLLYALTGQPIRFQPGATELPTEWRAPNLPEGLELNVATGRVEGSTQLDGKFNIMFQAKNGTGWSEALPVLFTIDPAGWQSGSAIELDVDIATGKVTNPVLSNQANAQDSYIATAALGDKLVFSIGFKKGDEPVLGIALVTLKYAMREHDTERNIVLSNGQFRVVGSGASVRYNIVVEFKRDDLLPILLGYENDEGTFFDAYSELEIATHYLVSDEDEEPSLMPRSTALFKTRIRTDYVPN